MTYQFRLIFLAVQAIFNDYECSYGKSRFNQFGDLERANLRKGNVHSADDWLSVLQPVVAR